MSGSDGAGDAVRLRIFISHTSELREFRSWPTKSYVAAVERAISAAGHVIVDMVDFPASDQPVAQMCAERVRACDVYVGVLGTRYGSPVRDKPEVSYTELEFDTATAAGMPRLMFLMDMTAVDVGIPLEEAHRSQLRCPPGGVPRPGPRDSGLMTASDTNPDQLGKLVGQSLRGNWPRYLRAAVRSRRAVYCECGISRPATRGSPAEMGCWQRCGTGWQAGGKAVVQAFQGMGGVGKTQLAIEYVHLFAE